MDVNKFREAVDRWAADVGAEAERLFRDDIPADHCIAIATKIVEARTIGRARDASRILMPTGPRPPLKVS